MAERVGVVGLGRMGGRIAARLLDRGYAVTVFDVRPEAVAALADRGAAAAASPRALAGQVPATITMVSDGPSLLQVLQGPDGLLAGCAPGFLLVDMTTIGVDESAEVAAACREADVGYVRAPVLGTLEAAADGSLTALVSGPAEVLEAAQALLRHLAAEQRVLGSGEEARIVKLVANDVLASSLAALAEGLVLAERTGLDASQLLGAVADSSMASPALRGTIARLREHSFEPRLTTTLLAKDLDLLVRAAEAAETPAPTASVLARLFRAAAEGGWGDLDASAVLLMLEEQARAGRSGS